MENKRYTGNWNSVNAHTVPKWYDDCKFGIFIHWGIYSVPAFAPHTWLLMGLEEGRYHQVRKMVAAVGHRCQRLIRVSIEGLVLEGLAPGAVRELSAAEFFSQLNLTY